MRGVKDVRSYHMESYSYSSISSYDQCPKAFEFKYVQKLPEAFSTIEQYMGRCVHAVINEAYASQAAGSSFSESRLCTCYDEHWNSGDPEEIRVVKRGTLRKTYYAEGLVMLRSFYSRVYSRDESESLLLEHRFQVDVESGMKRYSYTGVIDRLEKSKSGAVAVVDFKTGKSVPDPRFDLQLQSYAIFAFQHCGANELELRFENLRSMTSSAAPMQKASLSSTIGRVVGKIDAVEGATAFPAKPSILCDWCGFNDRCPSRPEDGPWLSSRRGRNTREDETGDTCPRCGSELTERDGRRGTFIGCTAFPRCRYTRDDC
jgi:putative RecB family exonuclease